MKYVMSMFADKRNLKESVLADAEMTDMEKLENIFAADKDELKKQFPELYYSILAVLDSVKKPDATDYFMEKKIFAIDLCNYTEENIPEYEATIFVTSFKDIPKMPPCWLREEISELIKGWNCEGICGVELATMEDVHDARFADNEEGKTH